MPNTYTQIYVQVIFAVQGRKNLIDPGNKDELEKYVTGIITRKKQKLYAISCMPDHVHFFISMEPTTGISVLVRDVKNNSTRFINQRAWTEEKFGWQKGFGAFSYGQSQIDLVVKYINNQEIHHS
ncbi:MAG: IS200/IS605 family transposase, partial [bacterium]